MPKHGFANRCILHLGVVFFVLLAEIFPGLKFLYQFFQVRLVAILVTDVIKIIQILQLKISIDICVFFFSSLINCSC